MNIKRTFLPVLALLAAFVGGAFTAQAKDKVIEHPAFTTGNTPAIEVSRVAMSDTATVLHVYARFTPKNWISIAKTAALTDNNGRKYACLGGDGITPGEKLWMPESGEAEFRLIFEPVDPKAATVTFTEDEGKGGWTICGIRLDGARTLPAPELPAAFAACNYKVDRKTALPEPLSAYGVATVKLRLLDYSPALGSRVSYDQCSIFREVNTVPRSIDVSADGTLSFSLPVAGTTAVSIYMLLGNPVIVFVEPGKTTEVCVNLREYARRESVFHKDDKPCGLPIYVKGPLADVAQEYACHAGGAQLEDRLGDITGLSVDGYKALVMKALADVRAGVERMPVGRAARELLMLDAGYQAVNCLVSAPGRLARALYEKGIIQGDRYSDCIDSLAKTVPADYIPRELAEQADRPQAVLAPSYVCIIGSYEKERIAPLLGAGWGTYLMVNDADELYRCVSNDFTPLDDDRKARLAALPEGYRRIIGDRNDALLKTLEERKANTGYSIRDVPAVADSLLFDSIAARYRGKVVVVDVWETWCGPCRLAHERMAPMKKNLAGKDVVFVYLASESSPENTWRYMVADITGEHYRLTGKQSAALRRRFKITGVPTYIILDRDGKVTYRQTGFPGVDRMRKEIEKNF